MDLVKSFEETNGNYHWYLRESFRERIRQAYSHPTGQAGDRNWFCRLLVVLAVAKAQKPEPKSSLAPGLILSGPDLFGQAVSLFNISEVPSTDDIETLNLMVVWQFLGYLFYVKSTNCEHRLFTTTVSTAQRWASFIPTRAPPS
jgi:hypothetical protein